ncbi:hypothetical protein K438DRAFT_1825514 [Mycena galopus ATCC 62051]|nr:hypothetical protein K438DRAFT_1825514 [Mycena galopus ATCC 62051]
MDPEQSFYDVLQIPRDATPDQIRKAYKKQALLTHPDRLPAGFTPAEKQEAEERFRNVSNAYEVLKEPENRRLYDMHGVWPPPVPPQPQPYSSRHQSHRHRPTHYPDPFENFFFADPFDLFDRMFSDYRRPSYRQRSPSNWGEHPFEAIYRIQDMMADLQRDMPEPFHSRSFSSGFESPFRGRPFGEPVQMRWAQQSTMVSTINGVTHRIDKRRDWEGNEHVTRTYPDGTEIRSINGVEQPSRGYLPPPGPPPQDPRNMPPPPPQMNNARGYISPPPSYHSSRSGHSGYSSHAPHGYHRHRHSSGPVIPGDPGPVIPDIDMDAPRTQRKWWHPRH